MSFLLVIDTYCPSLVHIQYKNHYIHCWMFYRSILYWSPCLETTKSVCIKCSIPHFTHTWYYVKQWLVTIIVRLTVNRAWKEGERSTCLQCVMTSTSVSIYIGLETQVVIIQSFMKQLQGSVIKQAFCRLYNTFFNTFYKTLCYMRNIRFFFTTWWHTQTENDPKSVYQETTLQAPCYVLNESFITHV